MSERQLTFPVGTSQSHKHNRMLLMLCTVCLFCAIAWIVRLQFQLAATRNEITTMQREAQIQALINNLSAPSEVILNDYQTNSDVAKARLQGWQREGIKTFVLYNHIYNHLPIWTNGTTNSRDTIQWHETDIAYAATETYEN